MQNTMNTAVFIGGIIFSFLGVFNIYIFFESTTIAAKLFSAGSFVLLLFLLIPFWIQLFKSFRQNKTMR